MRVDPITHLVIIVNPKRTRRIFRSEVAYILFFEYSVAYSSIEINMISTTNKVKMFGPLASGWISDDDVDAMLRICEAVDDAKEAKAIQQSVDLISFSDIGQRTQMRVGFSRMPGGWIGG